MKIINPYIHPKHEELLSIFSITEKEALIMRRKYIKALNKLYEEAIQRAVHLRLLSDGDSLWLVDDIIEERRSAHDKYARASRFIERRIKEIDRPSERAGAGHVRYEKEDAKRTSCRAVLERFGVEYPARGSRNHFCLRDERTPSCALYANETRWHDYGSGEDGDVIDLYMKLAGCDFQTAVKELVCV